MENHGSTKFLWRNDLLIIEPKGPFNDEGLNLQFQEAKAVVLKNGFKKWRRLEILDEDTMSSPSGLEIVRKLYQWYESNGCYATAVVVNNIVQVNVLKKTLEGSTVQIFQDPACAMKWLNEVSLN